MALAPAPPPTRRRSALLPLIAIVVFTLLSCALFGVLVVLPSYNKFIKRSRQSECFSTLQSLYRAQRAFYADNSRYTDQLEELGSMVRVERPNRYAYFLSARGPFVDRSRAQEVRPLDATGILADTYRHEELPTVSSGSALPPLAGNVQAGLAGTCPDCSITLVCVGDVDRDPTLDVWSVSTQERRTPTRTIDAGEPYNDVSDPQD
jgi:type IV pilus assembly protein PilA